MPDGAEFSALDAEARRELRGLSKAVAEIVGRHLVAAGLLVDEEPERALEHARYARTRASRVAIVREAAGLTAYHAGEWAEALSELRAARRMSGGNTHIAVMADCERALGRPERALDLAAEAGDVPPGTAVELRIVSAGARRDMGQLDAAVVGLQGPDLDRNRRDPWSPRLFYAYADNLAAAGRVEDAIRWFLNAAEADDDEMTDAAERAVELGIALDPSHPPAEGTPAEPATEVEQPAAEGDQPAADPGERPDEPVPDDAATADGPAAGPGERADERVLDEAARAGGLAADPGEPADERVSDEAATADEPVSGDALAGGAPEEADRAAGDEGAGPGDE